MLVHAFHGHIAHMLLVVGRTLEHHSSHNGISIRDDLLSQPELKPKTNEATRAKPQVQTLVSFDTNAFLTVSWTWVGNSKDILLLPSHGLLEFLFACTVFFLSQTLVKIVLQKKKI